MKPKQILGGAIALMTLATAVKADVEVLITGATAFRTAALNALKASYDAGGSYVFAHNKAAGGFNGADRVTFQGTFPGVNGVTTVRCSFNGSVEGIRAVVLGGADNPAFITDAALASPGGDAGEAANENANVTGSTAIQQAKFTFSDVRQSSTPINNFALNPASPKVGVVVFCPIVNEGAPGTFTNVTSQQFKALFSGGFLPLSVFTGNAADTNNVYAAGRNDGSGTRTTYMAESGLGITTLVNQYKVSTSTSTAITQIQRVPAGDGTNASTVWGQDLDGNGGYFSGSALRTELGKTSASVEVLDSDGSQLDIGVDVHLVSFLSASDCVSARVAGARILGWNGSTMASLNTQTTIDTTDLAKVTEGQYSAWGFENLYYAGSLSTDENTVYTAIKTGIPTTLTAAGYTPGIPLSLMNVTRPNDGAPIAP
jgi:hypothetical protein